MEQPNVALQGPHERREAKRNDACKRRRGTAGSAAGSRKSLHRKKLTVPDGNKAGREMGSAFTRAVKGAICSTWETALSTTGAAGGKGQSLVGLRLLPGHQAARSSTGSGLALPTTIRNCASWKPSLRNQ